MANIPEISIGGINYKVKDAEARDQIAEFKALTNEKIERLKTGAEVVTEALTGYNVLNYSLPSDSIVDRYWNNVYQENIPAGTTLEIRFCGYSGNNFSSLNIWGTTSSDQSELLHTFRENTESFFSVKTSTAFVSLYIQIVRSEPESPVSFSLQIKGDYGTMLGNDIISLKKSISDSTGNMPIAYRFNNKAYSNGTIGNQLNVNRPDGNSNNFVSTYVPCSEGDKFTIIGYSGSSYRLWAFLDSNQKVVRRETNTGNIKKVVTAMAGESYLVINNNKTNAPNAVSYYSELLVDKEAADISASKAYMDGKFDTAVFKRVYLSFVADSYVKITGLTADYIGWKRTTFTECTGQNYLYIYATTESTYNCFYSDKDESTSLGSFTLTVGMNTISVPTTAKYFMLSNTNDGMDATYVMTLFEHNRQLEEKNKYLRVCTFNIARPWPPFMEYSSVDYTNWQIAQFLAIFGKINADILCLQEAMGTWNSSQSKYEPGHYVDANGTVNLYESTMQNKYDNMIYIPNDDMKTVSKFKCLSTYREKYPVQYNSAIRKYERLIFDVYGKRVGVFNTHLEYHGDFSDYQGPQVEYLCDKMQAAITTGLCDYAIACGDMNTWDESTFRATVEAKGFSVANGGAFGTKTTWAWENYVDSNDLITDPDNPTGPKIPKVWNLNGMDNIIISSNISIQNIDALEIYEARHKDPESTSGWPIWEAGKPVAISDHYPFYADLRLN